MSPGRRARLNSRSGATGLAATVWGHELRRGLPSRKRGPSGGSSWACRGCHEQMAAMSRFGGRLRFATPALCEGAKKGRSPSLPRTCEARGLISVDRAARVSTSPSAVPRRRDTRCATQPRRSVPCVALAQLEASQGRTARRRNQRTDAGCAHHTGRTHLAPPRQHPPAARCSVRPRSAWRRKLQPAPRRRDETGSTKIWAVATSVPYVVRRR